VTTWPRKSGPSLQTTGYTRLSVRPAHRNLSSSELRTRLASLAHYLCAQRLYPLPIRNPNSKHSFLSPHTHSPHNCNLLSKPHYLLPRNPSLSSSSSALTTSLALIMSKASSHHPHLDTLSHTLFTTCT